jgi:protein SSD1
VKPQFAGHVVAVVERMPGQLFSGTLGLLRPSSAATKEKQEAERREREGDRGDEPRRPIDRPKIVWFKPTDKRVTANLWAMFPWHPSMKSPQLKPTLDCCTS